MHWSAPHLLLALAQFFFSGWHLIGSLVLAGGADALIFALYRELIAVVLMYGFSKSRGATISIAKDDYRRFVFLGFCSFLNVVGAILSMQYISATRFALFQPSIPCIATCISVLAGFEKLTVSKAIGVSLAVGGAVLIEAWKTDSEKSAPESNVTLGTIIVSIQVTGMAMLIVFQKPLFEKYDTTVVTLVYYSIGTLFTIVMCICWASRFSAESLFFDGAWLPWVGLAYASIFATLINYNIISFACSLLVPSITTVYCTLQPVGTALLSLAVFGYVITLSQGVGGALVILGLIVIVYTQYNSDVNARNLSSNSNRYRLLDNDMKNSQKDGKESLVDNIRNNVPFTRSPVFDEEGGDGFYEN